MSTGHPIGQSPSLTQERGLNLTPTLPSRGGGTELARGLFFLDAYVLFGGFGGDGRGRFGGVVLLNVSCGSGDSPPCLATTDADEYGGHDYRTKQNNCPRFRFVLFHLRNCVLYS